MVYSSHSEVSMLWCQSGNGLIKDGVLAVELYESAFIVLGNRGEDEVS